MKKSVFILLLSISFISNSYCQKIENLDFISPFNNGVAAIKKGDHWGFVDKEGTLVVPYRKDLVTTKHEDGQYPIFNSGRCLYTIKKGGINYFGYINKQGRTIIEPQFLNATNFNEGRAIVLNLDKENLGQNNVLNKNVISYSYAHVIINVDGKIMHHLTGYKSTSLLPEFIKTPPTITTELLSDNLYMIQQDNGKITIKNVNE
ncbi:WG repeat-containing protein [Tenacibaculum sp. IB213877]|uniref:WG repeat-containing protein n=1 Tax=Tenacibaculum sp. IB213877 TaxID=3097351 RepID=UPI002A5ABF70|nr:WG repeat-containing protein [Tenacibaculum sp. IB213877]MDY0780879.1 WG repeat-containing protein [Tenacibaculum sp. IB213877]